MPTYTILKALLNMLSINVLSLIKLFRSSGCSRLCVFD